MFLIPAKFHGALECAALKKLKSLIPSRNLKPYIRGIIVFGVIIYLSYQLSKIGWLSIAQSIPDSPMFYILSAAILFVPILAERTAFKVATKDNFVPSLRVFTRKHVLNKAVLTYSGEAYLAHELSEQGGLSAKAAVTTIKDLALIRTFVANLWVIILALVAVIFGQAGTLQNIALTSPKLVVVVGLICLLVCLGTIVFFKKLSNLPYGRGAKVAAVFLLRSFLVAVIMIEQWSLAIPGNPLSVWFIFMVVFSIARKSPIGGEMVFISVALALPGLESHNASVAAMLMTLLALNQINYLFAFLLTSDLRALKKDKTIGVTYKLSDVSAHRTGFELS